MKKVVLLSVLGVFLLASKSQAQGFRFITSFGVEQRWDIPYDVFYTVDHHYFGYNWVHASRVYDQNGLYFDVLLQRGDMFVRVSIDRRGRIFRRVVTYDYPLYNHVCNDFCGYHSDYYVSHHSYCGSAHHHGHNHVVYRPVVVNKHYHHPKGNAYGYYKKKGHGHYEDNKSHRIDYDARYPTRRSGSVRVTSNYEKSRLNTNRGGRDHDHGKGGHGGGYDRGDDKGNDGKGYGRGGNRGNNGNAYGRGKDTGKGNGLGRGRGDGNKYTEDDRSKRGDRGNSSGGRSRTTYRSRTDK